MAVEGMLDPLPLGASLFPGLGSLVPPVVLLGVGLARVPLVLSVNYSSSAAALKCRGSLLRC